MALNSPIRRWSGQRVWIVGASTGIGAALAEQLLVAGARVAISAREGERLRARARALSGALALPLDVRTGQGYSAALAEIVSAWGGLDVVVFNAGTYEPMHAWSLRADTARELLQTNLLGVFDGLDLVLPLLLRQRSGHIALVASVAGYRGLPRALCYGPSKAALINLAESLWLDLAAKGIGVSLINPGFVATRLTARNDFRMPALISPDRAAREIIAGLARGSFEIHFPLRFSWFMKGLRLLPAPLYLRLLRRLQP